MWESIRSHPLEPFEQFAAVVFLAVVAGGLALRLKQPLIVAFLGLGILVGPVGLGWAITEPNQAFDIELLSKLGVVLLLFVVGLRLDLHLIRTTGAVALATGVGQVVFTSVLGFGLALAMGMRGLPALYTAVALTFSSTIIIVKLLSDKREIGALHGRIAVGLLIVQDLLVILVLIALSAFGAVDSAKAGDSAATQIAGMFALGVGGLIVLGLLMKYVLPRIAQRLAHSVELLVLFGIAWALLLAAGAQRAGFSMEVGAFLAGISLASTAYRDAIATRLISLRDFLLLFFFIQLGSGLQMDHIGNQVVLAIVLSAFVLVGNPLIVMVVMGVMGYRRRTGFLTGLTVAQISEFSLILGALGVSLGHIGAEVLGLITLVGLITIGLSTYLILYSHPIYRRLAPWLTVFERRVPHREGGEEEGESERYEVILFGLGRYGSRIAQTLVERGHSVLGVDFNPAAVREWRAQNLPGRYGDAEDPEFPATLPLEHARCVVSAVPHLEVNAALLNALREHGYTGRIALPAHSEREADALHKLGADIVLLPFADAAETAAAVLMEDFETK